MAIPPVRVAIPARIVELSASILLFRSKRPRLRKSALRETRRVDA
jgi:hypothetical protein